MTIKLLAMLAWAANWLIIFLRLRKKATSTRQPILQHLNTLWLISLALHGITLLQPLLSETSPSFSLSGSLSIVMWLSSLVLYVTHLKRPLETMGLLIIPIVIISLIITLLLPQLGRPVRLDNGLGIHIMLSLIAYSMLGLAALQALLLAAQHRQLHSHKPGGLIRTLPPLQDMEALLFRLLASGVVLLTLGLLSGFIFLDGFFGKQVAHKTLLSITAWLTFSTLLFGHWLYGWRGKTAIRWTIAGFVLLMLAFLGSKLILEYVVTQS